MRDGKPLLELRDVSQRYRARGSRLRRSSVQALSGINLTLESGRTTCLIGETGSGKSTLGRILVGLTTPSDGAVLYRGRPIAQLRGPAWREYRRSVQMVFQNPTGSFNPMLTVGASIRDALRYSPLPGASSVHNAARLLEQVELAPQLAGRYPDEVSGGELQRASIARALATEPTVIFLDEPASALDVSIRGQIFNVLRRLQGEHDLAYAIVSHDMATVRVLGDDVFVLYLGESVEYARQRTFHRPAHPYALALLSASPVEAERRNIRRLELSDVGTSVSPPPFGCPFQPRCWLHRELGQPERCVVEKPRLSLIEPEHEVACHYADLSLERATNRVGTSGRNLSAQPDQ